MEKFQTIQEILDFAINAEQESVDFYSRLTDMASNLEMKKVFQQFSQEEMGHKARLLKVKETGIPDFPIEKVLDLKLSDYLVSPAPSANMDYQDALLLAMRKEKNSFRLYMGLSEKVENSDLKALFLSLAVEESKHKLRFELEYDENVLKEN